MFVRGERGGRAPRDIDTDIDMNISFLLQKFMTNNHTSYFQVSTGRWGLMFPAPCSIISLSSRGRLTRDTDHNFTPCHTSATLEVTPSLSLCPISIWCLLGTNIPSSTITICHMTTMVTFKYKYTFPTAQVLSFSLKG